MEKFIKNRAFTLAEVLITLGIIGVVAALTLPSLIQKYQQKVLVHRLEVANSVLVQGFAMAINDYGFVPNWTSSDKRLQFIYTNVIPKYFKVIKICEDGRQEGCSPKNYKHLNGEPGAPFADQKTYVLANGMNVIFNYKSNNYMQGKCSLLTNFQYLNNNYNGHGGGSYGWVCGYFFVDINGKKLPNRVGEDLFMYYIAVNGIIPSGSPKENIWCQQFSECYRSNKSSYPTCTAWVLYNKNMDYLHCDGLSWDGAHNCQELNNK